MSATPIKFDEALNAFRLEINKLNKKFKTDLNGIVLNDCLELHFNNPNLVVIDFNEKSKFISEEIRKEILRIFREFFPE